MRASAFTWQTLPYIHSSFTQLDAIASPLSNDDGLITWLFNDLLTNITEYVGKRLQPTFDADDGFGNTGILASFYSLSETGKDQTLRSNHCFTFALRPKTIRRGAKEHHRAAANNNRFLSFVISEIHCNPKTSGLDELDIRSTITNTAGEYVTFDIKLSTLRKVGDNINGYYIDTVDSVPSPTGLATTLYPDAMVDYYRDLGVEHYMGPDYTS